MLFCKRNFVPWRRFVHICNDFIKKRVVCFQPKAFAFSFPFERLVVLKDYGRIWLRTPNFPPSLGQKATHSSPLSVLFLRTLQGEDWSKQYPWVGQEVERTCLTVQDQCTDPSLTRGTTQISSWPCRPMSPTMDTWVSLSPTFTWSKML